MRKNLDEKQDTISNLRVLTEEKLDNFETVRPKLKRRSKPKPNIVI
jgi:hypothetical protein